MITPSRRRATGLPQEGPLELHLRLARRASVDRRLLAGAAGALAASLIGLLFAPSVAVHALIAAAGFVIGAALPTPGSLARAFGTIREQAGLSYETSLELRAKGADEPDPYDFKEQVATRARLSIRDVRPKQPPAWWLPLVVVAFGLLLIPGFAPANGGADDQGFMSGQERPGGTSGSEQDPSDTETDVDLADPSSDRSAEPDEAGSDDRDDTPPADPTAPGDGDGAAPLSRFLDSLRERPADSGGRSQQDQGEDEQDQSGSQGRDQDGNSEADSRRLQFGDGTGDETRELTTGSGDPDGQDMTDGEAGPDGPDGSDGEEQGEGPDPSRGPRNPFEQAGGPSEEQGQEPVGDPQAGEGEDGLSPSSDSGGDDGGDGMAGEGSAGESPAGNPSSGSDTEPDVLRGVLTEGPESLLGTVLLPGRDEVELPEGVSFAQYAAAAEDALTEGDIPLEYQEILRRYFR